MLDVNNLQVTNNLLPCGYTALTNIWNGKPNPEMSRSDHDRCEYAIRLQASDSHSDRLRNNYEANLRLSDMFLYTVLWDEVTDQPVQLSGAQMIGHNACRLYSRFYIFSDYRVHSCGNLNTTDKLDNFDVLKMHVFVTEHFFEHLFITRDRGIKAFQRFKRSRPDIFSDWTLLPEVCEVGFEGNYQGCLVRNLTDPDRFRSQVAPDSHLIWQ